MRFSIISRGILSIVSNTISNGFFLKTWLKMYTGMSGKVLGNRNVLFKTHYTVFIIWGTESKKQSNT